jgi:hypothetical protein
MKTEFHFGGMRFGVTDGAIPEVDPRCGHGTPSNHVGVYVDHEPFRGGPIPEGEMQYERKAMFYLKPSEARTLASALMTAAQNAR